MSLLHEHTWKPKYHSDKLRLIEKFYVPALRCAHRYHRSTGYFSAPVLTLACRGIENIVRNEGRMLLVVGCTLNQEEIDAIERGESLRNTIEEKLRGMPIDPDRPEETDALELLAWMVARGYLEVKVGIPCSKQRKPMPADGIFHEKAGIIEDKTGDRIAFNGSNNETVKGWQGNWESFHVFTDWERKVHVDEEERTFALLWANEHDRCLTMDVPKAIRDNLLEFLPKSDQKPKRLEADESEEAHEEDSNIDA